MSLDTNYTNSMKTSLLALLLLATVGCGVDVLTTAATTGTASAQSAEVLNRKHAEAQDALARVQIERALQHFQIAHLRSPTSLAELIPEYLPSVPQRADGSSFEYDALSGRLARESQTQR